MARFISTQLFLLPALLLAGCTGDEGAVPTDPMAVDAGLVSGLDGDPSVFRPRVVPPSWSIFGRTYGEWSTAYWQWLLSIPAETNPGLDDTGEFVGMHQWGPVWYLAGNFGRGGTVRTATIPRGRHLFVMVAAWFCSPHLGDPKDVGGLRAECAAAVGETQSVRIEVDGREVENLGLFRVQSPELFGFVVPGGNVFEWFGLEFLLGAGRVYLP